MAAVSKDSKTPVTVYVASFPVNPKRFKTRAFTPESLADDLRDEITASCQKQGLELTDDEDADIKITGRVFAVDEGNQMLRYIIPFLAGASSVHVEGVIQVRDQEPEEFKQVVQGYMGLFGGSGTAMIRQAIRQIGLVVAGEASGLALPETAGRPTVTQYFLGVGIVTVVLAALFAVIGSYWAMSIPQTNNSIKPGEVIPWAMMNTAGLAVIVVILGVAFAPSRVLQDRKMVWLLSIAGTKSLAGMRAVLIILGLFGLGLFTLMVASAAGS